MNYLFDKAIPVGALLLVAALSGCGDDGDEQPPTGDTGVDADVGVDADADEGPDGGEDVSPDAPDDTEAPEYRDVRISVGGEFSSEIDLGDEDASQILPAAAPATFKLFLRDDTSSAGDLSVEIVDAEGDALTPTEGPTLQNGLWNVTVDVEPGMSARPRVRDEAGNEATYEAALVIPTRAEAVADDWRTLWYGDEFDVTERWLSTFADDGTWQQQLDADDGWTRGGDYAIDDGELEYTRTFGEDDADQDTAEWREVGEYYVDETYFERQPLTRQDDADGLVGTWSYTYQRLEASGDDLESRGEVTRTLTFGADDTWEETLTTSADEPDQTRSGTYTVEVNSGYAANFGDALVRTITHEDGEELDTAVEQIDLHVIQLGHLLISPRIRGHAN